MNQLLPKRIVRAVGVSNQEQLLVKKDQQITLEEKNCTTIKGDGYILLDFGKELAGGIRILTAGVTGGATLVRIRFGESVTECCAELGERGACNDHSPRDFQHPLVFLSDITIGNTGFRFVRIDVLEDKQIRIKSILATHTILQKRALYRYTGDDKLIAKIYATAKRTVDLCAHKDYVWDGIKRDRLVWIGDMHPEMLALTSLYGRIPVIENSLDLIKRNTPLPSWMNNYPSYSMWWLIILADYYKLTGCRDFIEDQLEYLQTLIKLTNDHVDEQGHLHFPIYFVDWPTSGLADEIPGVRAITIMAVQKAIEVLKEFELDATFAKNLLFRLKQIPIHVQTQKQVIALKYFAEGSLNDDEYETLIEGGAKGMSTFMSYYILTAVAARDPALAIQMMKEYFGAMLDKGATTFWEDFNIDWCENSSRIDEFPKNGQKDIHGDFGDFCYKGFRHSLCHGWSSGVIKFIKDYC